MRSAHLILNGEFYYPWVEKKLDNKQDIYCTDGAYNRLYNSNITIDGVIGDMDSIEKKLVPAPIIYRPDQNYTDFEKSLQYLSEKYLRIYIFGSSGGDVDHFLGNMSIAKKYQDSLDLIFINPGQYFFFAKNPAYIEDVQDRIISIIPFPDLKCVESEGLKYPLNGMDLSLGNVISTRNLAVTQNVKVSYESGTGIIVVGKELEM